LDNLESNKRMKHVLVLLALTALSACNHAEHGDATKAAEANMTPAQKAYAKANARMHHAMAAIPADPDVAFMSGMVPHHQGAVDMARIVLEHGKDPKTRALAETIIKTQEAEIAEMTAWLKAKGITPLTEADHAAMGH
jgi:uncharacterized protein (DUF305 family)